MVEWAKFKPEVSGSLLVLVVCLMLAIVSISFPYWLTNVGGGGGGCSSHHRQLRVV